MRRFAWLKGNRRRQCFAYAAQRSGGLRNARFKVVDLSRLEQTEMPLWQSDVIIACQPAARLNCAWRTKMRQTL